jgi:hypothetical protein
MGSVAPGTSFLVPRLFVPHSLLYTLLFLVINYG